MAFVVFTNFHTACTGLGSRFNSSKCQVFIKKYLCVCAISDSNELVSLDETNQPQPQRFILPCATISQIVSGTMLEDRQIARIYSSDEHGFSNDSFFEQQLPLGGVPSLLLGRTETGMLFGGYTAFGFAARDDYREATSSRALFVFSIVDDRILIADPTELAFYDFYDYAARFGASLLGIPMNPAKHVMKANVATSRCRMPNGTTSLFGEFAMAKLEQVEVLVAQKHIDAVERKKKTSKKGLFSAFFG